VKTIHYALTLPKNGERSLKFSIAGVISAMKKIITKKGQPMLFVTLEDKEDSMEVLVFNDTLGKNAEAWTDNNAILIDGFVSWKNGDTKFIADSVKVL
jgi:DNA polymerase-3 subunit alpha